MRCCAKARVGCLREYCGYGCCHCVGRNFYDSQRRTTSACRDVGRSTCAAAIVGRPHHYRLVGLGRVNAAATIDKRLGASLKRVIGTVTVLIATFVVAESLLARLGGNKRCL